MPVKAPQQSRSQQTLERILSSSTALIAEKSYEELSIADIARDARVSVGTFYTRFENKRALLAVLRSRFGEDTNERIRIAMSRDWSNESLQTLIRFIVDNNVELYEKYRGVLTTIHLQSRIVNPAKTDVARNSHNDHVASSIETLILRKREEIQHSRPRVAARVAIACMSSMLREAIVFGDTRLYPKSESHAAIARQVTDVMYRYLVGKIA